MMILIWSSIVLLVLLSVYSVGAYLCVILFFRGIPKTRKFTEYPENSVGVLIPARNEGGGVMRAIHSVLSQDHRGHLEIFLLLKDRSDTSLPFLKLAFPRVSFEGEGSAIVELSNTKGRKLSVAFTGDNSKSSKLNWMALRLTDDYLAILDSDHEANPEWIRSSLTLLHEQKSRIIQGRRGALSIQGFFQLWDSLHQHIGCEMFNTAFAKVNLTLFFTGTTVVMESTLLKEYPLSDSITEDVEFSYRIFLKGEKIIYNPYYGSNEEVSPNMYSFLARRRRWANGHTSAFFSHVGNLANSPLRLRDKIQFLFHGVHYLIAVFVFILHLNIGLIIMHGMSVVPQIAALLSSLIIGVMIVRKQRPTRTHTLLLEMTIVITWILPAVVIAINLTMAFLAGDMSQAELPIPYTLQAIGLAGLSAPLLLLLAGLAGFKQLSVGTFLVILSYPIVFYLDIMGVLIGLVDFVTNRQFWHVVARAPIQPVSGKQGSEMFGIPALGIKDSLRISSLIKAFGSAIIRLLTQFRKPSRIVPWLLVIGLLYIAVKYTPTIRIPVTPADCQVLEHDSHPWIVAPQKISGYCGSSASKQPPNWSKRTGNYLPLRQDNLNPIPLGYWDKLDSTFFCNKSIFTPANVIPNEKGGVRLKLSQEKRGDREFTSGSLATKTGEDAMFRYGRFEVVMKPIKASGVLTAFFLYRFDPWQEIDMEFLGRDTTRIMLNVFYNPGVVGDLYNYGYRGTPVIVSLGFDASEDFHRYAIEWDAEEIRWFADDKLIHRRSSGSPTPIPHLPMRFFINTWPTCSEELAGPFSPEKLPLEAEFKSVSIYGWKPASLPWLSSFADYLFPFSGTPENWRKKADWIQPPQ